MALIALASIDHLNAIHVEDEKAIVVLRKFLVDNVKRSLIKYLIVHWLHPGQIYTRGYQWLKH